MSDSSNSQKILQDVRYAFPILDGKVQSPCSDDEYSKIIEGIKSANACDAVRTLVIEEIKYYIRQKVGPAFWSKFVVNFSEEQGFEQFRSAVDDLYSRLLEFLPLLKRLEQLSQLNVSQNSFSNQKLNILAQFKLIVRSTLLSQLPVAHDAIIEQFYKIALNVFCNTDSLTVGKTLEGFEIFE